ncbi:MAG: diguanylate cyclase [Bryobacteraceae bacterium]|nr:diguanylate cyclase [Bryobacteraceae bacterium]
MRRLEPVQEQSRRFEWTVVGTALVWLAVQAYQDHESGSLTYVLYLVLSALSALGRFGLPTVSGNISVSFIFVLAAMPQLPLTETLAIGITGAAIHALQNSPPRTDWLSLLFQVSVWVIGIEAAHAAYEQVLAALPGIGLAAAMPLASIVLFLVTAFPLAAATSLHERELLRRVWKNRYLWSLPYYMAGAAIAGLLATLPRISWSYSALIIVPAALLVYYAYRLQLESLARERQHAEELAAMQLNMVEALALAVESKDVTPLTDLQRMAHFAEGLGRAVGLEDEQIKALRVAAVLHDIGQVAVPDHIIMKPGRLTPDEFQRLKVHPEVGAQIIEQAGFPRLVSEIVRAHHERWDGTGYPAGLRGEEIPIEARVLAAVDMLVALNTERRYRRALSLDEAMERVRQEAGLGLDPMVVARLECVYRKLDMEAPGRTVAAASVPAPAPAVRSPGRCAPMFLHAIAEARREEQLVLEFSQILGSSLDLEETLNALARRLHAQMPFETMVLFLKQGDQLRASFIEGQNYTLFHGLALRMNSGVTGRVASTLRPVLNAPPTGDPIAHRNPVAASALKSALIIPLDGPGGLVGTLNLYSAKQEAFTHAHLSLLLAISSKLAVSVENSARFQEAESRATVDFLTGLPNAGALFLHLQNELARCARTDSTLGLLVCDLDGFKGVNDQFGHLAGNRLLQLVAQGLRENCREYDFVARMGGDEFVLVLPGVTEEAVATRLQRLRAYVECCGIELCGEKVVSLSGGAAFYPRDGQTAEELLARADSKMYGEKKDRKQAARLQAPAAREASA